MRISRVIENIVKKTDTRTVALLWSDGRTTSARSNNGQFFFCGPILYSYGPHYVAGVRLPPSFDRYQPGGPMYLLNADKVSVTTSKHLSFAYSGAAVVGFYDRIFKMPGLTSLVAKTNLQNGFGETDFADRERIIRAIADHMAANGLDPAPFVNLTIAAQLDPAALARA